MQDGRWGSTSRTEVAGEEDSKRTEEKQKSKVHEGRSPPSEKLLGCCVNETKESHIYYFNAIDDKGANGGTCHSGGVCVPTRDPNDCRAEEHSMATSASPDTSYSLHKPSLRESTNVGVRTSVLRGPRPQAPSLEQPNVNNRPPPAQTHITNCSHTFNVAEQGSE